MRIRQRRAYFESLPIKALATMNFSCECMSVLFSVLTDDTLDNTIIIRAIKHLRTLSI